MASSIDGVIKPIVAEGRTGFCDKIIPCREKKEKEKKIFFLKSFSFCQWKLNSIWIDCCLTIVDFKRSGDAG